jgi:hypothetical protein
MEKRVRNPLQALKKMTFLEPEDFDDPYEYESYLLALMVKAIKPEVDLDETKWIIREIMDNGLDAKGAYDLGLRINESLTLKVSDERH